MIRSRFLEKNNEELKIWTRAMMCAGNELYVYRKNWDWPPRLALLDSLARLWFIRLNIWQLKGEILIVSLLLQKVNN